ncbi:MULTISPECIES: hypothetical protein [unclassified Clostridium]|uniref:hypothetical protein n=1 Tax=unclassified Clostridium TaxID=2614128 RepID=UPI0025C06EE1|nr:MULTISPECIES: hypothetical protein [unclassified Clostridium]
MSGIWKINMVQNQATQQDFNKTTFRKGDSFSARILNINKESGEIVIRLLDGRQFPAKIDGFIEDTLLENYLLKFVVDDFSEGKLTLVLGGDSKPLEALIPLESKSILEEVIKNLGLKISKGDEYILKEMLKFNIPLTQENFDEVKTIVDFTNKINITPGEEDNFIEKYLTAKNIEPNSEKGVMVKNTLKNFFSSLKTLDLNSLLMMKEENIPITEENIKSFNNINKEDSVVVKNIQEVLEALNIENKDMTVDNKISKEKTIADKPLTTLDAENKVIKNESFDNTVKDIALQGQEISDKEINNKVVIDEKNLLVKNEEKNINSNEVIEKEIITSKEGKIIDDKVTKDIKENKVIEKDIDLKFKVATSDIVKSEIKEKVSMMKDGIMQLIKTNEDSPSTFNKVMQLIESKMHDFKVFNTLSNDYYYLNVPMNIKEQDYDCKLVIKDERGKGKKIDSRNIKIATSIRTLNMEVVDAFINVNNDYINIDIHSQKAFMDVLEVYRYKLIEDLSCNSYVFNVNIKEKIEKFTLSNCREFFDDNDLSIINVRV